MHPNLFQFGRVILPTYGFLVALAAILSLSLCLRTARLLALNADKVWSLALVVTLTALAASRILSIGGESVTIAISSATGLLYAIHLRLHLRRTADAIAPALALAGSVTSIACLEAGCDYGTPTHLPWAVIFRELPKITGSAYFGFWEMLVYLGFVAVGLFYIVKKGILDWSNDKGDL